MIKHVQSALGALQITWLDNNHSFYPYIWLRDVDPSGFHPQTGERQFDLTQISIDLEPSDISFDQQGVSLQWPNEKKRSLFPNKLLKDYAHACQLTDPAATTTDCWLSDVVPAKFSALSCVSAAGLKEMLLTLKRNGLVIISNLVSEQGGEQFGDLIGFKRETNFGVMFEVLNKAEPNNLAYTAVALALHTDLPNQEMPPGYQFLHCVTNNAQGGESVLADGFAIAQDLRREEPTFYQLLCSRKMPFRFHDQHCDIRFSHPLISEENGQIKHFIFNAHLAVCVDSKDGQLVDYYRAYQNLMQRIRQNKYALKLKLQAGEMMIFDNKRVLHGRTAFDPSTGERHLRGYYIDHGEVDSKIRMLSK
ncbi:MAG: TauD/TfdA family dioxygenase [Gammaproteobacteria bacterium]|nr:TauD/TfdA family dioxygenase [Gammaproteobacteria bacterium]